jgi:hypothetical protein
MLIRGGTHGTSKFLEFQQRSQNIDVTIPALGNCMLLAGNIAVVTS